MNISKELLNNKFELLCNELSYANSKEQAIEEGKECYYILDNNPVYGGYRFAEVEVKSGGNNGAFGFSSTQGRVSKKEIYLSIVSLINNIELGKGLVK